MKLDLGGSHIPLLVEIMAKVNGPVLELGSGWNSTPILGWLCFDKGLEFQSYDNNQSWINELAWGTQYVRDYSKAPIDQYWGLVLIDHSPANRRNADIIRLKDFADYIIIHDTEPEEEWRYKFSEIYPLFKYRKDYTKIKPYTTVLSNKYEL